MGQDFLNLYSKEVLFSDFSTNFHPLIYIMNFLTRLYDGFENPSMQLK